MVTITKQNLGSLLETHSDELLNCVHCGLCLPSCPTYRILGNENDSPRGRVYLMRGVVEGKLPLGETFATHMDLCLGCRACETACPSGVPYGHLLEAARAEIVEAKADKDKALARVVRFVLNNVFTRPRLLGFSMKLAKWFRDSGLAQLAFESNLVGGRLRFALAVLLSSRSPFNGARKAVGETSPAQDGKPRKEVGSGNPVAPATRVAVLTGCVMEGLFTETNRATERVLARNGCEVTEAQGQVCCGALHAHAGHLKMAKELARKNIEAFLRSGCEFIVVNSAGCGAAMKEYKDWLADDAEFASRAREFSAKVRDVSEFLAARGITPPAALPSIRVTYDAPCHLIHAQRLGEPPMDVIKQIPGVEFTMLPGYEHCCGGAGIYNLQHPELSAEILEVKLANVKATGARLVATANPGCIMQIGAGALMRGIEVDMVHPVDLLDAAYGKQGDPEG